MSRLFRLLGILLLVVLLAVPMAGCRPWESAMSLIITVNTPQDGANVTTSPVTVSGTLSKTGVVQVNGTAVTRKGAEFSSEVKLNEGSNVVEIAATAGKETVSKKITINYTPAK